MKAKKKKKIAWQQYIAILFMMLIGGVCGFLMTEYIDSTASENISGGQMFFNLAFLFVDMCIALYIQTIIHEAGHLVFGHLTGYRFSSFRIGSFMWIRQDGKLRFRRLNIAGTGGQCLMVPPEMVDEKIPVGLYNLGGSLMNIISAVICLVLRVICGSDSMSGMFFMLMAIIGIAFAIINGVPMRMGMVDNDGYNAFSLGKNPEALKAFWIQMKMNEQIVSGVRIKDMPDEWFIIPSEEGMRNSMIASIAVFACNRLMDQMKFEEAGDLMRQILHMDSGIIGVHRNLLICDLIYCELVGENRQEKLDRMLNKEQKKFMKSMKTFPSVIRTEYVYALLSEKDEQKATRMKDRFNKRARTYPHPVEIEGERELMKIAENIAVLIKGFS